MVDIMRINDKLQWTGKTWDDLAKLTGRHGKNELVADLVFQNTTTEDFDKIQSVLLFDNPVSVFFATAILG